MEITNELIWYAKTIHGLQDKWEPHTGQVPLGKALFYDGIKEIFVECGRNFGKTEFVAYALWRWARLNPRSESYYFGPLQKQAREILWESRRILDFGPRSWVENINETQMRITFTNGSFIKVDGSDNTESYRGVKPKNGLIIYDEFKDFRPEFHVAFEPNLAAHSCSLLILGTPPEGTESQFFQVADEFKANPRKRYFNFPTSMNPHISKTWLSDKKAELYARGEGDIWEREYEAKRVRGGSNSIFPMLKDAHKVPYEKLLFELKHDMRKLKWFISADPGTSTCFAVLFGAINPYSKKIYLVDEIYETDQQKTTTQKIGLRILQTKHSLRKRGAASESSDSFYDETFTQVCDEAGAWFINEMLDQFNEHFSPTQKHLNRKEVGLSLIKDLLLKDKLVMSDRCTKLFWEMANYIRDHQGRIPKERDHLIDCLRYMLGSANYGLVEEKEPIPEDKDDTFRGARISDDFHGLDEWGDRKREWEE